MNIFGSKEKRVVEIKNLMTQVDLAMYNRFSNLCRYKGYTLKEGLRKAVEVVLYYYEDDMKEDKADKEDNREG